MSASRKAAGTPYFNQDQRHEDRCTGRVRQQPMARIAHPRHAVEAGPGTRTAMMLFVAGRWRAASRASSLSWENQECGQIIRGLQGCQCLRRGRSHSLDHGWSDDAFAKAQGFHPSRQMPQRHADGGHDYEIDWRVLWAKGASSPPVRAVEAAIDPVRHATAMQSLRSPVRRKRVLGMGLLSAYRKGGHAPGVR
jgi:hypothetical protein